MAMGFTGTMGRALFGGTLAAAVRAAGATGLAGAAATGAASAVGTVSAAASVAGAGLTAGDAAGVGAGVAAAGADGSSRITGDDSCPPSHSLLSGKPIAARTTTTAAVAPSVAMRLRPGAATFGVAGTFAGALDFDDGAAASFGRAGRPGFASAAPTRFSASGPATVCGATGEAGCSALIRILGGSGAASTAGADDDGAEAAGAATATGAATTAGAAAAGTDTDVSATGEGCAGTATASVVVMPRVSVVAIVNARILASLRAVDAA